MITTINAEIAEFAEIIRDRVPSFVPQERL